MRTNFAAARMSAAAGFEVEAKWYTETRISGNTFAHSSMNDTETIRTIKPERRASVAQTANNKIL